MKTFLAIYTGSPQGGSPPSPEAIAKGMAAWTGWMSQHAGDLVVPGGPLGKTKKVSSAGVADIRNTMAGFTIVKAESHDAAAQMFENHPHFTIFPGDGVEIMEVLPVPGS